MKDMSIDYKAWFKEVNERHANKTHCELGAYYFNPKANPARTKGRTDYEKEYGVDINHWGKPEQGAGW
jgi:hypothetical protein